mmetsp:Transcript_14048/g.14149  ORF Transcript_14048/g.14149 Transcript_14048/m.14149 type:complete len:512 (+) Transcript_14048:56-1591(+)
MENEISDIEHKAQEPTKVSYVPNSSNSYQHRRDILLGAKLLCICDLSYKNSLLEDTEEIRKKEATWIEKLKIKEYEVWNHRDDSTNEIVTQAITGVIHNLSDEYSTPAPFVCVRGTQCFDDMKANFQSLSTVEFTTSKDHFVGRTGWGFTRKLEALLDLKLLSWCVSKADEYKCLLLCGHSLGGGIASLLSAELRYDYPATFDKYPLKLVTFGCPRVFDKETAQVIDQKGLNYRHVRFLNDADIITMLPLAKLPPLYHTGEPYYATDDTDGFQPVDSSRRFDFSSEPVNTSREDMIEMIDQTLRFASGLGEPHYIAVAGGYMDRIINSNVYKEAVKSLPDLYRQSFESLPYDIPPPDELRDQQKRRLAENKLKALEFLKRDPLEEFKKTIDSVLPPPPSLPTLPLPSLPLLSSFKYSSSADESVEVLKNEVIGVESIQSNTMSSSDTSLVKPIDDDEVVEESENEHIEVKSVTHNSKPLSILSISLSLYLYFILIIMATASSGAAKWRNFS